MSGPVASASASRLSAFMNHPAGELYPRFFLFTADVVVFFTGPKTVFFWAPMMKWCLVAAGIKDLARPAEKLSVAQNIGTLAFENYRNSVLICYSYLLPSIALTATGSIWVRYAFVIIPKNYSLAAVGTLFNYDGVFLAAHSPRFLQVNVFVAMSGITQLGRIAQWVFTCSPHLAVLASFFFRSYRYTNPEQPKLSPTA
jgi:mitochondrial pyruvate carrier 2